MKPRVRLDANQRRKLILDAAFALATDGKLMTMSSRNVTDLVPVSCSPSTVKKYFKSLKGLRTAVIEEAIRVENLDILALALVNAEPAADKAPESQKKAAIASLV